MPAHDDGPVRVGGHPLLAVRGGGRRGAEAAGGGEGEAAASEAGEEEAWEARGQRGEHVEEEVGGDGRVRDGGLLHAVGTLDKFVLFFSPFSGAQREFSFRKQPLFGKETYRSGGKFIKLHPNFPFSIGGSGVGSRRGDIKKDQKMLVIHKK